MKSKITSLTRPSHFTLPLSNIVLQFTHPHQPGSIQEMLRSPHASELALHQGERGRGLLCTLRTRRRLCGGGVNGGVPRRLISISKSSATFSAEAGRVAEFGLSGFAVRTAVWPSRPRIRIRRIVIIPGRGTMSEVADACP